MSLNYLEADDYNRLVARFGLPLEEAYVEHTGKRKDKPVLLFLVLKHHPGNP